MAIVLGIFFISFWLQKEPDVDAYAQRLIDFYPEELTLTIQDGKLSTNVEEPYFVDLAGLIFSEDSAGTPSWAEFLPKNLLVIDTVTPFSTGQFDDYGTMFWLSGDSFYSKQDDGVSVNSLSEAKDMVINKELVDPLMDEGWATFKPMIPRILTGFAFAFVLLLWISRFIYGLFLAILTLGISAIRKVSFTYGQAYNATLHAMTLPILLQTFFWVTWPWTGFGGYPFFFSILTLLMVALQVKGKST